MNNHLGKKSSSYFTFNSNNFTILRLCEVSSPYPQAFANMSDIAQHLYFNLYQGYWLP